MTYIAFLSETRRALEVPSSESAATLLGAFRAVEVIYEANFEPTKPDTVIGTFVAPVGWIQNVLSPGDKPLDDYPGARKARYVSVRRNNGSFTTLLLDEFVAEPYGDGTALVTFNGYDNRLWFENFPSKSGTDGNDLTGTRTALLRSLTQRLSYDTQPGKEDWKKVPMIAFDPNWVPNAAQQAIGIVRGSTEEPGGNITIAAPDPLPIGDAVDAIFNQWPDHSLYPLLEVSADGTLSPFWRWVLRKRVVTTRLFSERNGGLKVLSFGGKNRYTDVLSYLNRDQTIHRYTGGTQPSNLNLTRAWLGVEVKGYNLPEESNPGAVLPGANTPPDRTQIDTTVDFGDTDFPAGGTGYIRIEDEVYEVPFDTVTESPGSSVGAGIVDTNDVTRIVDTRKISFVVNGESFSIPFQYRSTTNNIAPAIDVSISVDGKTVTTLTRASATVDNSNAEAIARSVNLTFPTAGNHLIEIFPRDGVFTPGWGRAFGFFSDTSESSLVLCNRQTNRTKLIRVLTDPDYAHMVDLSNTLGGGYGYNFRMYQWYSCTGLEESNDEDDQYTGIEELQAGFRDNQYQFCSKLKKEPKKGYFGGVKRIYCNVVGSGARGGYRISQFATCAKLTESSSEPEWTSLQYIYGGSDGFMIATYQNSPLVKKAGDEGDMPELLQVTSTITPNPSTSMKSRLYAGCIVENFPHQSAMPKVTRLDGGLNDSKYYSCKIKTIDVVYNFPELTTIGTATPSSGASTVGLLTRMAQNNKELTSLTLVLKAPKLLNVSSALTETFAGCTKLVNATVTLEFLLATQAGYIMGGGASTTGDQGCFQGCTLLETVDVAINFSSVTAINDFFFGATYMGCSKVVTINHNIQLPIVTSIRHDFFNSAYRQCTSLKVVRAEGLPSTMLTIGNRFRFAQYYGCTALDTYADIQESFPTSITTVGVSFRSAMFSGCTSLTQTMKESNTTGANIGNDFRSGEYTQCTSITKIWPESGVIWPATPPLNYRNGRFIGCSSYNDIGADIIELQTAVLGQNVSGYRSSMFFGTGLSKSNNRTVDYVDGSLCIAGLMGIPATNFYPA